MDKIKIPFVVTRDERALIKSAYLAAVAAADEEKLEYIVKNLPKVLKRLSTSDEDWHRDMAVLARDLTSLLKKGSGTTRAVRCEIVAALHYLCQPFGVIPDYVPGRGYADDALILNTCAALLRQRGIIVSRSHGPECVADKT